MTAATGGAGGDGGGTGGGVGAAGGAASSGTGSADGIGGRTSIPRPNVAPAETIATISPGVSMAPRAGFRNLGFRGGGGAAGRDM